MNKVIKPKCCGVCGIDDGKTQFYIGIATWMHPKCSKIADTTIKLYLKYLTSSPNGLTILASEILKTSKHFNQKKLVESPATK